MTITMCTSREGNNGSTNYPSYIECSATHTKFKSPLSNENTTISSPMDVNTFFIAEECTSCKIITNKEDGYKIFILCLEGSNIIVNEINDHVIVMGEGICKMTDGTTVEKTSADDSLCEEYIYHLDTNSNSSEGGMITSLTEITGPYQTIHLLGADLSNE